MKLKLENYRLFLDSNWFEIAPLTLLVGRNSSGKSSILSSLLLLKQSVEQEALGWAITPLTLAGSYCDLGNYRDVVYQHKESEDISFSFCVSFAELRALQNVGGNPFVDFSAPRPDVRLPYGYYFAERRSKLLPVKGDVEVRFTFSVDRKFGPGLSRLEIKVAHLVSATFVRTTLGERRQHWRTYTTTLPSRSIALRPRPRSFFPDVVPRERPKAPLEPSQKRRVEQFVVASQLFFRYLQTSLVRSDFVGPFRTPPERRYAFAGFGASKGSPSGEQAVDFLITETMLGRRGSRSLHAAVSFWLKHLKLAGSLQVKDIAKRLNLFELDIAGAGRGTKANLADVGFGISQILPVLVQGLLMREGGLYLVQQPEIHLHPDAQAGLADFFIFLASHGINTVVETHSEYLLLRIRRRLAEGVQPVTMPSVKKGEFRAIDTRHVSVLYSSSQRGKTTVQQLLLDKSFQFRDLPKGFMNQALEDRLGILEALKKRHA
jgi:hypothetical protein